MAGVKIVVDFLQGPNNSAHNFRVCVELAQRLTELTPEQQLKIVGEDLTQLQDAFPAICENISDLTKEMYSRVKQAMLRKLPLRRWFLAVLLVPKLRWIWTSLKIIVRMNNQKQLREELCAGVSNGNNGLCSQMAEGTEQSRQKMIALDPFRYSSFLGL